MSEQVFFGPPDLPPPDWRAKPDLSPDDDVLTPQTPADVLAILGFDPLELTELNMPRSQK